MFNMTTMAADECRANAQERTYYRWIDKASKLLGHQVALGSQEESDLHDLYMDGCTPAEAVTELLAQQALESPAPNNQRQDSLSLTARCPATPIAGCIGV